MLYQLSYSRSERRSGLRRPGAVSRSPASVDVTAPNRLAYRRASAELLPRFPGWIADGTSRRGRRFWVRQSVQPRSRQGVSKLKRSLDSWIAY